MKELYKLIVTFGKAAFKRMFKGGKASDEVKEKRLEICSLCIDKKVCWKDRCLDCGCVIKVKAGWSTEECPVGKWGPESLKERSQF